MTSPSTSVYSTRLMRYHSPSLAKAKMMRGKQLPFPKNRRLVLDICQVAQSIPTFPVERSLDLGDVRSVREQVGRKGIRIAWVTLFTRAYSLACQTIPELRQLYASSPWPRLYEHPHTVASITIHRDDPLGGKRLIWGRIDNAESQSLLEIQTQMDRAVNGPLEVVFRDGIRMESLPRPMRRFSWWMAMHWQPRQRAKKIGTFSISTLASEGILNRGHPLVTTSSLAYSRCDAAGHCCVTLLADHRVLDGMLAAHALRTLESNLTGAVLAELQSLDRPLLDKAA